MFPVSSQVNPAQIDTICKKFEKKVEGYCLASDASFAAKFKYALYRITNAVKAIFNRSDWQCARREMGAEIQTQFNELCKPLAEIPLVGVKIELSKKDAETFADAFLYISIDSKLKKFDKMSDVEKFDKISPFDKEGKDLIAKLANKFGLDAADPMSMTPAVAPKLMMDPKLAAKARECLKEISAFAIKLDIAEKATVNACSKCGDVVVKMVEQNLPKFKTLLELASGLDDKGVDEMGEVPFWDAL